MRTLFFTFLYFILAGLQSASAQSYAITGIEKSDKQEMQYEILGKVADRYWIYKNNAGIGTIAQYDQQMKLVKQNDLAFLPKNINAIEFITRSNKVFALYQFQVETTVYAAVAELGSDAQLVGSPRIIDTVEKIRPGAGAKVFNLLESANKEQLVLFTVNTTKPSQIKIKVRKLSTSLALLEEANIAVQSTSKKSNLSDFSIDNKGNLFCLRNIEQANAAPVTSLLYLSSDGSEVIESTVVNNFLLLDDIRLTVDNASNRVILNSFYATAKKGNIEGLFSFIWDIEQKKEMVVNASRFSDATRAVVAEKRNLKDAFDHYYFDKIKVHSDGTYTVIAESARSYSNRNGFSRWDYFWGGPFYNPFMFNYWYRPFGFYPWARFGWGSPWLWSPWMNPYAGFGYPSVTYTANKIALLKFDTKGDLQSIKTIDKKQADQNVDQFIGYGLFETSQGVHFLYYQKQKGVRQLIKHHLSNSGEVIKDNGILLQEKNFEWMPRSLKQVGENETILPYQYKGKLGFAKIQF